MQQPLCSKLFGPQLINGPISGQPWAYSQDVVTLNGQSQLKKITHITL